MHCGEGADFDSEYSMKEAAEIKSPTRLKLSGTIPRRRVKVGNNGCLKLPPDLLKTLGAVPGTLLDLALENGRLEIYPNIHCLARVYIEPTSRCNLTCQTCVRNTWNEPLGDMEIETFDKLAVQLAHFEHLQSIMFAGFGEPTAHKDILAMIKKSKGLGLRTEMTTNGTLLDKAMITGLFESGLNILWVSFDGTTETSFENIREGAGFYRIIDSLKTLEKMNRKSRHKIMVGITFVMIRRNLADLRKMDELARSVGAEKVLVSNVLPYSEAMEKEMLCLLTLTLDTLTFAPQKTEMSLPRLDVNNTTKDTLFRLLQGYENLSMMGNRIGAESRQCRFIRDRATFVRWDGKVSPCMGLLHAYKTYLYGNERSVKSYSLGNVNDRPLWDIWNSEEYKEFRKKVHAFDFSPCHVCGGCSLLETNDEDCYGNAFPACGGCLWAQGVIQCP